MIWAGKDDVPSMRAYREPYGATPNAIRPCPAGEGCSLTVADLARPSDKRLAFSYNTALVLGGSILIALCTQVAFGYPIPVTGQTFAVLFVGALLGSRLGALSVLTYLGEGLMGLPVFSHGKAGPAALAGPTGGYLIGFVAAAYLVGALAERGWDRRATTTALAIIAGNIVLYGFGLAWLFCLTHLFGSFSTTNILAVGLYPFLPGEVVKIALAVAILPSTWKIFHHFRIDKIAKM
jgi:biotin transport system substrate-specific component